MSQERKPGQPGTLYLIPCPIAEDTPVWDVLPAANRAVIDSLDYFIVENVRSARRFLSKAGIGRPIDSLEFRELNEHTTDARGVLPELSRKRVCREWPIPGPWRWPGVTGSESAWCL